MELREYHPIHLVRVQFSKYDEKYSYPRHSLPLHQLYYVIEGGIYHQVEDQTHHLKAGQLLWIAPGLQRKPRSDGSSGSYFVVILDVPWKDLGVRNGKKFILDSIGKHLAEKVTALIPLGESNLATQIAIYSFCLHFLGSERFARLKGRVLKRNYREMPRSLHLVIRAENIMTANIGNRLRLEDIAFMTGTSHATLDRFFQEHRQISPYARFREIRLEHAKELIQVGEKSITDIALETGFSSSQHLATSFRRHFGKSPSSYRKHV
jgi:AraC-like DNA-binding protein